MKVQLRTPHWPFIWRRRTTAKCGRFFEASRTQETTFLECRAHQVPST